MIMAILNLNEVQYVTRNVSSVIGNKQDRLKTFKSSNFNLGLT